ncbi:MAG: exosortase/archaeosortase family protein [Myxococcota bacterium]
MANLDQGTGEERTRGSSDRASGATDGPSQPRDDGPSSRDGATRATRATGSSAEPAPVPVWRRIERRDLGLAGLIAVVLALSPLTPPDWLLSLGAGALVGAAFVAYRVYARTSAPASVRAPARPATALRVPWLAIACLAAWGAAFAPTWVWMYGEWTSSVWQNNHGLFIPVVMVLLARSALRRDSGEPDPPSAWGWPVLGLGLALAVLDATAATRYLSSLGLVITLPGLSLLLLGRRRTLALGPVWLIGFFMLPVPTTAFNQVVLRNWTAAGTVPLLQGLGLATLREQTMIALPNSVFIVGDACSGFQTLYASFAASVFMACYCRYTWRRFALLALFAPLALAANILRAFALVLFGALGNIALLDTMLHEASGVAAFFGVLFVLYRFSDRERLQEAFA